MKPLPQICCFLVGYSYVEASEARRIARDRSFAVDAARCHIQSSSCFDLGDDHLMRAA